MNRHYLPVFLAAVTALSITWAPVTRGEDSNPSAPAATAPAKLETPAPATVAAPPAPSSGIVAASSSSVAVEPAAKPEAVEPPSKELRRLDAEGKATLRDAHQKVRQALNRAAHRHVGSSGSGNERVSIGHDTYVAKDEKAETAVSILGSTTVDGDVGDAAVSVLGSTTVNGSVGDAAVAVMGSVHVSGHVGGDVVSVGGNIELGPDAVVDGDVVVVGGTVQKDAGAVIRGEMQQVSIAQHFPKFDWLFAWVRSALFKARLLSFAPDAAWAWLVAAAFLAFYVLLALLFRSGIEKCAETLEQRPGFTILTALLTMLAMPLVIVILAITGIGVVVIPFLLVGLFAAKLFGRAAMFAWLGRRVTGLFGPGLWSNVAMSVLVGGIIVCLLYTVPILAFVVSMTIGILGLGTVILTLINSMRRSGPKPGSAAPLPPPPSQPPVAGVPPAVPLIAPPALAAQPVSGAPAVPAVAIAAAAVPPIVSAAALPRAGFWIRMLALGIDLVLCCMVIRLVPFVHFGFSQCLFLLAIYAAVMWKLRGTTVGGSICHLKVVRLDDRPLDWTAAIIRALSCFLSLVVAGLGFIWVAFDDEKQSWHDKIAGTTVVVVPKSISLI